MPFEVDFHAKYGYKAEYTGHPMPDSIDLDRIIDEKTFRNANGIGDKPVIALVPGSRRQELTRILPHMLKITDRFPEYQFVVAGVSTLKEKYYKEIVKDYHVNIVYDQTYDLLRIARAAAVKSGTVTLETAMLGVPQVVCYRFSFLTALIAWLVVHVKYISLVNLILNRKAVAELIQYKFNARTLGKELRPLLSDGVERSRMLQDYAELLHLVGPPGASARAANLIAQNLKINVK
jgi:lipid-A-disaccharide synthase